MQCNYNNYLGNVFGWTSQYLSNTLAGGYSAYNYYSDPSNGLSSLPHDAITFDSNQAPTTLPGNTPCIAPSGNAIKTFHGLLIWGAVPPGMPTNFYGSTMSWDQILNDLMSATPPLATAGMNRAQVVAYSNLSLQVINTICDGCGCCTPSVFKEVRDQILTPVYHDHPNWGNTMNNALITFSNDMWLGYSNNGCAWWATKVTQWVSQLPGITNPNQLALKMAKIEFAQAMHVHCCCPGPVPQLTGGGSNLAPPPPPAPKIIGGFDLDLKDIKAVGETREFAIIGTKDSVFSLEITNEDSKYYNFQTNLFQTAKTKLNNVSVLNNSYSGRITFPTATDADQYDFTLTAEQGTSHDSYTEVRFADGSIDINSSTGSNSNILKKVIYQTLDTTITLSNYSGGGLITGFSNTDQTISASRGKSVIKTAFEIKATVSAGALTIDRQPLSSDIMAFVTRTIGSLPSKIPGENIYPTVTGTDTVNGAVTSGTTVIMDTAVASTMSIGDRVTGNTALNAVTATVVSLDSTYVFTLSQAIAIADGISLTFSNQRNYRWPVDNIHLLADGMKIKADAASNGFTDEVTIKEYLDQTTIFEGEINEKVIVNKRVPGLDTLSVQPTLTRNGTTNVETIVQTGNISFSEQALLTMKETAQKIFSYGPSEISRLTGYEVIFSDLKAVLNTVTTTTTAAVSASTTIPVTSKVGIVDKTTQTVDGATTASKDVVLDSVTGLGIGQSLYVGSGLVGTPTVTAINETTKKITLSTAQTFADGITLTFPNSIISGIGINKSVVNPYVDTISSLNLTSSVAQTLEDAQTFTFTGAGDVVTITGNIIVNNVGNEDVTLRFDVDKFLTQH